MRLVFASVVAALAIVAAGCGGGSDENTTTTWADGVCSAVNTWTAAVQSAGDTLRDTSSLSVDSATSAVQSVIDATATLKTDVESLDPPELEGTDQAQQTVTDLTDTLESGADTLQQTLDTSGGGVSGLLERISTITSELGKMASAVGQAVTELQSNDAAGELKQAFEDADSCDAVFGS